ncbi:MAG: hypothetical protein ACYCOY_02560 [Metallibacterium sp.]
MIDHPTGAECDCARCGYRFPSIDAFDRHRIDCYGPTVVRPTVGGAERRCLTEAEMQAWGIKHTAPPAIAAARLPSLTNTCPHFAACSAAYCPLTGAGQHVKGDRVCRLLLAHAKGAAVHPAIAAAAPRLALKHADIRYDMQRASAGGDRADNLVAVA